MFKEKEFNKKLIFFLFILIGFLLLILIIGEKSSAQVLESEISNMQGNYASVTSNISMTFNRVMDKKSVEDNLKIAPPINGNFVWIGKKVLFIPKEKLLYDTHYIVSLTNAKDSNEQSLGETFSKDFQTKPRSVYFLSEEDQTKGFLKKVSLDNRINYNVVEKSVNNYAISPDGNRIVYSTKSQIFEKDLTSLKESEINIPNPIGEYKYNKVDIQKLLYGPRYIIILIYPHNNENSIGNLVIVYDLSTTEIHIFAPKDKIDYTDTLLYTPDYKNIIYRDSSRNYAYASIEDSTSTIIGSYISVNGFDYKQNKLALTDSDPTLPQYQYVAFVDEKNKKQIISDQTSFSQDPSFANATEQVSYSISKDTFEDFNLFGIATADIGKDTSRLIYFDKNYSAELSSWSPDDKFISFERYSHDLLKRSVSENRVIFNYIKPLYGQIVVIDTSNKNINIIAEKGKDIIWDN